MHVEIYTKDGCPFCTNAKTYMTAKQIAFTEKKLGIDFSREWLIENFAFSKSYPIIVVDGMTIGGYTDLMNLVESQKSAGILLNESN